jgi:hypothetical protein
MIIEGYLKKQANGGYLIKGAETTCELTSGECIEVNIDQYWITMRIEHDGEAYYLLVDGTSFYPKSIYARYDTSFSRF